MLKEEVLGKNYVNKLKYEYVEKSFDDINFKVFLNNLITESGFKQKKYDKNEYMFTISFGISDSEKMKYLSKMLKDNNVEHRIDRMNILIDEYHFNNFIGFE